MSLEPIKKDHYQLRVTRDKDDDNVVTNWYEFEKAMQMIDPMLEAGFEEGRVIDITVGEKDGKITLQLTM